jgi:hypothetical protein
MPSRAYPQLLGFCTSCVAFSGLTGQPLNYFRQQLSPNEAHGYAVDAMYVFNALKTSPLQTCRQIRGCAVLGNYLQPGIL